MIQGWSWLFTYSCDMTNFSLVFALNNFFSGHVRSWGRNINYYTMYYLVLYYTFTTLVVIFHFWAFANCFWIRHIRRLSNNPLDILLSSLSSPGLKDQWNGYISRIITRNQVSLRLNGLQRFLQSVSLQFQFQELSREEICTYFTFSFLLVLAINYSRHVVPLQVRWTNDFNKEFTLNCDNFRNDDKCAVLIPSQSKLFRI